MTDDPLRALADRRLARAQDLLASSPMAPILNELADRLEPADRVSLLLALLETFELGQASVREQEA